MFYTPFSPSRFTRGFAFAASIVGAIRLRCARSSAGRARARTRFGNPRARQNAARDRPWLRARMALAFLRVNGMSGIIQKTCLLRIGSPLKYSRKNWPGAAFRGGVDAGGHRKRQPRKVNLRFPRLCRGFLIARVECRTDRCEWDTPRSDLFLKVTVNPTRPMALRYGTRGLTDNLPFWAWA